MSGDTIWCDLRGVQLDPNVCVTACVAPEHRPVCWMGRIRHEGEDEMATKVQPPQEVLVEAIASALPGYGFTASQWFDIMFAGRNIARSSHPADHVRLFYEDVSRAADAMHNRLNGAPDYLGKEELDKVLGPREA